jgi:hypothetical protein
MNTPTVYTKAEENLVRSTHKFKDCVFGPLMKILSWIGVSPNFIAFLSAFTLISTLIVAVQMLNPLIFIYGLWLHFILDSLDGPLARFQYRANASGFSRSLSCHYIHTTISEYELHHSSLFCSLIPARNI